MRHSNQLSCKYVSTLINLRMNRDLYHPVQGLFYTGSEDLWPSCELKSDGNAVAFFPFIIFFYFYQTFRGSFFHFVLHVL